MTLVERPARSNRSERSAHICAGTDRPHLRPGLPRTSPRVLAPRQDTLQALRRALMLRINVNPTLGRALFSSASSSCSTSTDSARVCVLGVGARRCVRLCAVRVCARARVCVCVCVCAKPLSPLPSGWPPHWRSWLPMIPTCYESSAVRGATSWSSSSPRIRPLSHLHGAAPTPFPLAHRPRCAQSRRAPDECSRAPQAGL